MVISDEGYECTCGKTCNKDNGWYIIKLYHLAIGELYDEFIGLVKEWELYRRRGGIRS